MSKKNGEIDEMGKLIILSLEESEQNIYDEIMKIVGGTGISVEEKIDEGNKLIENGELEILPNQYEVLKRKQVVNLTNIEFRILYVLALHQGCILSKEQIYRFVWNGEYLRDDSNITSHVRRLRKKIEDDPSQPKYIQTVRGVGYRMNLVKKK